MRYGIISDIHGNLEAFETALEALSHEKIDKLLCGGDIVGYGANPRECIKMTNALGAVTVCGNHDAACIGLVDVSYFNETARAAIIWTKQALGENDLAFLNGLSLTFINEHLTLVHGTLEEPEKFHYMLEDPAMSRNERLIVNTGSVGQPRDGDPRLCYCICDTDTRSVELKRLSYDIEKAQKKTLKAGLPSFLAYRLGVGV